MLAFISMLVMPGGIHQGITLDIAHDPAPQETVELPALNFSDPMPRAGDHCHKGWTRDLCFSGTYTSDDGTGGLAMGWVTQSGPSRIHVVVLAGDDWIYTLYSEYQDHEWQQYDGFRYTASGQWAGFAEELL